MFVAKKVVVITKKSQFALDLAKLSARGEFIVTTYVSAANALAFIEHHAQHAVIIDFDYLDMPGEKVIEEIRALQPDIAVIVAPNTPQTQELVVTHDIQALIMLPFPIRQLVVVIQNAIQSMHDALPDTVVVRAVNPDNLPEPKQADTQEDENDSSIPPPFDPFAGRVPPKHAPGTLGEEDTPQSGLGHEDVSDETVFDRLRAEEPPLPSFEQSGTVKDLFQTGRREWQAPKDKQNKKPEQPTAPALPPRREKAPGNFPAAIILDRATDDSTPLEGFSITRFMDAIREEFPEGDAKILPLPSWVADAERYIHEPDFLQEEDMPERFVDYTSSTTAPNALVEDETAANFAEWGTERIEPIKRSHPDETGQDTDALEPHHPDSKPPSTMPEMPPVPGMDADERSEQVTQPAEAEFTIKHVFEDDQWRDQAPEVEEASPEPFAQEEEFDVEFDPDDESFFDGRGVLIEEPPLSDEDTHFARIALTLTQVSLDLAGDATILAQDGQLVAHAGPMPLADIEELMMDLQQDWANPPATGKIRFVHQTSTGQEYMLYSCKTEDGFVLSMLFAGAQPISMIREQAQQMADALAAVPERVVEPDTPEVALRDEVTADEAAIDDVDIDEIDIEDDWAEEAVEPDVAEAIYDPLTNIDEEAAFDEDLLRDPVAFVWLLRDLRMAMPQAATELLERSLRRYLEAQQWRINELVVESDYVYLYADVPGENILGNEEIESLRRTSAELLKATYPEVDPDTLWADSSMVVTPGRELDTDDIQRFIRFARR
ncbi:hypothetical protein G4Y79_18995 [Phototrophicus methaneseepsis]|uniref:Response regulatory domain-containing protein n=1 Tax=Phototrophicus methaneseepsis TaxID=2710758 RepID=A0A7S8E7F3_9CHLR|nr:hypothetical protein [Phototrophicus methaneseepsis]QPC81756.1 hypothetical protein G4Y79_18995 [Phototrophicus methaneseepsis]